LTIGFFAAVILGSPFTSDQERTVVADRAPAATAGPTTTREFIGDVPTSIAATTTVPSTTTVRRPLPASRRFPLATTRRSSG